MPSRTELSQAIKGLPVWGEVAKEYKAAVPKASKGGDFATCLRDAMEAGRAGIQAYRDCAKKAGLSSKLGAVWTD